MFENMSTGSMVVMVAIILTAIAVIYQQTKKKEYKDIDLPIPETRRTDLLYGYYSALDRTYDQVKGHVNLFWYSHFFGVEQFIAMLKETDCKIVVDLAPYLFEGTGKRGATVKASAESDLRGFFAWLKFEGVLNKITYLYPKDEPNLFCKNAEEHLKAIEIVKSVRAEFSELANAKLAVIYAGGGYWMNMEHFDVVAVDNYDQKSELLTVGDHANLVSQLKPHQKTFLVPGPSFGHPPEPWVAYALRNPHEVEGVIPFIWFDDVNHKDTAYTGLEALPAETQQKWVHAANICLNKA